MTNTLDRRRRAIAIAEEALSRIGHARDEYVAAACGGDASLLADVQSLVAAHDNAGEFLEAPAGAVSALAAHAVSLVGRMLGDYSVEAEIGRGGMGVVYRARDVLLNRLVALKTLPPTVAADDKGRERLRREAQAAAALSHDAIARVYALVEAGDALAIVSELVEGETLRDRLQSSVLPWREATNVAIGIARGLSEAHKNGIVHRDLKPENVMLTPTGGCKVLDFGIARVEVSAEEPTRATLTRPGVTVGTPGYMAPEQLRGQKVDPRTDIFALGILLYEALTGLPPFGRGSSPSVVAAVLEQDPPPLDESRLHVPPGLARVILRCLEKTPGMRYQTAAEVSAALEAVLLTQTTPSAPSPSVSMEVPASADRLSWWWRFHQAATAGVYAAMLTAFGQVLRLLPGRPGRFLFLVALVAGVVTVAIRLFLWFTAINQPGQIGRERHRVRRVLWGADIAFAVILVGGGLLVSDVSTGWAIAYIAFAAGALVTALVIEPATARAAFGESE